MKRILFLGAARHQVPAIQAAIQAGMEIFTTDNLPDNPGHKLAAKSFSISAADPHAVLELATSLKIDGVLGFASEVCARTAARVADWMGLPGNPWNAVEILSEKDRFRDLLSREGIQSLAWKSFATEDSAEASTWAAQFPNGCVVKPVDNSGGRGITICPSAETFPQAFAAALAASWQKRVVVEEFLLRSGSQIGGDGWMQGGKLVFIHYLDNDTLPPPADGVAISEKFPSAHPPDKLAAMKALLEQMLIAAGYTQGPFNFDGCFLADGHPFVFEIAPRNGGAFIPTMIQHQTGVDLTTAAVQAAVDRNFVLTLPPMLPSGRYHALTIIASPQDGALRGIRLAAELVPHVMEQVFYKFPGSVVRRYQTAGDALGILLLQFASAGEMNLMMQRMSDLYFVDVDV